MSKENQRTYWKSLNQLAQNEEFRKAAEREFPENASELKDGFSRRNFLQIMGASVALAGLASCRKPVQRILPYSRQPEHIVPGNPLYYATSMPFKDYVTGLVVETNDGRPTKIEGNEEHPSSRGSTNVFQQAASLDLYDRDRARFIRQDGEQRSREDFENFCREHFADTNRRIAFISEASSSPTYNRLKTDVLDRFPNAEWVNYEPFSDENRLIGNEITFGSKLRTFYHFDQAKVVLSLDEDFMNLSDNNVDYVKQFAAGRKITGTEDEMNRLYSVESGYSLTGSNADHRLKIKASQMPLFVYALAAKLSEQVDGLEPYSGYTNEFSQHAWISVLAEDLLNNRGESIVAAGMDYDAGIHSAVAAINLALDNAGNTVTYHELPHAEAGNQNEKLAEVTNRLMNHDFDTVVIIGANPVFTAPADLNFAAALNEVSTSIHLSSHHDETGRLCNWHVNRANFLEAWGDGYSYGGTRSIIQPMIQPLFGGISEIEFLNTVLTGALEPGYDLVRETWQEFITDDFERDWQQILHDGLQQDTSFPPVQVSLSGGFEQAARQIVREAVTVDENALELVLKPHSRVYDGRFANNGWLQELPDSITKITWDNVAQISPATARRIGIPDSRRFGRLEAQIIRIDAGGTSVEIPAWIVPGHADNSITVSLGHGRTGLGRVADGVGVDTYPLRTTENPLYYENVEAAGTGETYPIATTQDHHSMEGRALVREASLEEYRDHPTFAPDMVYVPGRPEGREHPITLFNEQEYPEHEPQWGMSIDLNACIGCHACTIACQAENNIPVIGKREVHREREMHWIRVDRYFSGDDENNPQVLHQPVPCMQCELAPCEQVCPVAATTHSDDGLNQMTYNRCIGTRYCANNCPYKVRRFNFFNYTQAFLTEGDDPEIVQMAMNPDVTIRFRGVMEKCTYCVQRIQRGKIATKNETGYSRKPADGTVKTACQQACPADAIEFGDLTDEGSRVSQSKRNERNYLLLEEMNFRPRTSYLAKLRNPNPDIA